MKRILLFLMSLSLLLVGCSKYNSNKEIEKNTVDLPYELDGGKLVMQSLFESDIDNPDNDHEIGENIASLEIMNQSDEYLDHGEITLTMEDDTTYHFVFDDVPGNEKIWVFEQDSLSHLDTKITSIDYSTTYLEQAPLHNDEINVSVEGSNVTLTNLTDHDISNLTVTCHATFDETIYGGIVYFYNIQLLPANQNVSFIAEDCYLDSVMVVDIAY